MAPSLTQRVIETARKRYGVTVYDHNQWGSKAKATYAARLATRKVKILKADTLAFHITVTRDDGQSKAAFFADMREVESIGVNRFGSGVSYNFCIDMTTGQIGLGQPLEAKGTHTVNDKKVKGYSYDQNHAARAIAGIGMPGDELSSKALRAWAGLVAAMIDEGALTSTVEGVPHSLFAAKDCPTDAIRDKIPAIMKTARALRQVEHAPEVTAVDEKARRRKAKKHQPLRRALLAALNAEKAAASEARKVGRDVLAENLMDSARAKRKRLISFRFKK